MKVSYINSGKYYKKTSHLIERHIIVEMGGLEPPSKQGIKKLSTYLVFYIFSKNSC